jgi:diadenosine tetraphosphate (Ap4A) HIT family hydrolase
METTLYNSSNATVGLPNEPINRGHVIIRPINDYKSMDDVPANVLSEVLKITQVAVKVIKQIYNAPGYSMMQNGAWVKEEYFEIHVFPRWKKKDFYWTYGPNDPEAFKVKLLKNLIENDFSKLIEKDK